MARLANLPEDPLDRTQDPNPDLWDLKSRGCYPVALQALGQQTQPYVIVVHYSQGDARASEEEDQYGSSFPYLHCPPSTGGSLYSRDHKTKRSLHRLPGTSKSLATHHSGMWKNLLEVLVIPEVNFREPPSQRTPCLPL